MANTLRGFYDSDVLIAPAYSFTGSVFKADYTEKMAGNMIIPNPLCAWQSEMTGAQLKELVRAYVEGYEGGITPFNRGSLPTVSGISVEVQETDGKYTLLRVLRDDREIGDEDTFKVTCLNIAAYMNVFLEDENRVFEKEEDRVKVAWTAYIKDSGTLSEPENYITLK